MKNAPVTLLLLSLYAACCSVAADGYEWMYKCSATGYVGTAAGSSDDYDPSDAAGLGGTWFHMAVYHQSGLDGWTGPSGFFASDMRMPLTSTPGAAKTWRMYGWDDPELPPEYTFHTISLLWAGSDPSVFDGIQFRLTFVRSAAGVADPGIPIGETIILNGRNGGGWALPVYRTDNGLDGYVFDLTATVIPEPSALLALSAGLTGLALRRRR